jgi:hypothetical protein
LKREQREIYWELADEICSPVCCFCKYAEFSGPCEDGDIECKHPIRKVRDWESDRAMQLGDCWAYRPHYKLADIADIVGIIISHSWDFATWHEEDGVLKVFGRPAEVGE